MARLIILLFTLLLLPGVAAASRIDRMDEAPQIAVADAAGAALPAADVHAAILAAIGDDSGWVAVADVPGEVTLRRWVQRKHMMEVIVVYAAGAFRVDYRDSEQLNYRRNRRGVEYIHPNYIVWRGELEQAIVAATH